MSALAPPGAGLGIDVSVVVPIKDEVDSLRELTERVAATLTDASKTFELLLVDDGSTDGSDEAIASLCEGDARVIGIFHRRNFGKAQALMSGFHHARGILIVTMDGDLQDIPEEIPRLIQEMDADSDLVCGWKQDRKDPASKRLASKVFNGVVSWAVGVRLHDYNSGFKCYRREVVEDINLYGELHRFVPALAHARGFRVKEVAVRHAPRLHGKSKYGVMRVPKGFFDLLTVLLTTRYIERPLHFIGGGGLILFMIGVLILGWLSVGKLFGEAIAGRPLFFLGLLMTILGAQIIGTGLVAEVVVKSREEARPRASIRKTMNL